MNYDTSRLENFRYRPDVDGLRALAVIPVVFFHAALGFPGGFVGVDIFFVISGYLITTIIAREVVQGSFQMKNFWERRIRRILPAATVMVLLTIVAAAFILLPHQFEDFGKSAISQTMMVSNFYFWQQDGYFAAPSDYEPLLHTWSLAVEEQFYFVFPLLLVLLHKRGPATMIRWTLILFAASLAWSIYGVFHHQAATFYLLPARAWELLIGSIIAIVPIRMPARGPLPTILSWLGLALILFSIFTYSLATPFPGAAAIPPVLGAALLILANRDSLSLPGKFLALPPLVFIGKISYSLYLWHWPLLVFGKHLSVHETPLAVRWGLVVASFILGYLSWLLVENPFRNKSFLKTRAQAFKLFFLATSVVTILGTVIYKMEGIPARFGAEAQKIAAVAGEDLIVDDTKEVRETGELPLLGPPAEGKTPLPILVWGDSHAQAAMPVIRDLCNERKIDLHYACRAAHPPILDTNRYPDRKDVAGWNDAVMGFVKTHQIEKIILIARWSKYAETNPDSSTVAITDREGSDRSPTEVFETYLAKMIDDLHAMGIEIWIMRQVPYQKRSPVELAFHAHRLDRDFTTLGLPVDDARAHHATANAIFDRLPKEKVNLIDPSPIFELENGHTRITEKVMPIYFDEDHLSHAGARRLRPVFEPVFDQLLRPN